MGERAVGGDFGSLSIHNAHGALEDGTPWLSVAQVGGEHGPWGATRDGDADSYQVFYLANNLDPATEAIETDIAGRRPAQGDTRRTPRRRATTAAARRC